jgi:hypothetical protein
MVHGGNAKVPQFLICPGAVATNNCSSSIESQSGTWPTSEAVEQENAPPPLRGEFSLMQRTVGKFAASIGG